MTKLKLIDCNACIGLGTVNRNITNHENYPVLEKVRQPRDAAELLEEMDFCGVEEAIVYHQAMFDVAPDYGNKLFLADKANYTGRLRATVTVLPSVSDDLYTPDNLARWAKQYNLAGVRAFPVQNRYLLDEVTCGDLLSYLSETGLPLYLTPYAGWEHIFAVLKEFPKLTVIVYNYGLWGSDRYFLPLVKRYERVYIDTSDYQVIDGLRNFVRRAGSERLLFGTNYPMDNMGGPIATLLSARISDGDRENIAHRNIERLLAEVRL